MDLRRKNPTASPVESAPDGVDRTQLLPAFLWQKVFLHLENKPLAQVRLTCHAWKTMVDQDSELQDRFTVLFPEGLHWDKHYNPEFLHPAATGAAFIDADITFRGAWWSTFGARLTRLTLGSCRFTVYDLVGMLRATPNLEALQIFGNHDISKDDIWIRSGKRFTVDFQLGKLHQLFLHGILNAAEITSAIGRMRPPLKVLHHLSELPLNDDGEHHFSRFVLSVAETLEALMIVVSSDVLSKLSSIDTELQLQHLALGLLNDPNPRATTAATLEFVRKQPQLTSLSLPFIGLTNDEIRATLNALPNLEDFSTQLLPEVDKPSTIIPSFLKHFPNLKELAIGGDESSLGPMQSLCFPKTAECPHLVDLTLQSVKLDKDISHFWKRAPNLTDLTLKMCSLKSWITLAGIIPEVKLLQKLTFVEVQLDCQEPHFPLLAPSLKELHLQKCGEWPATALMTLVCYYPKLEAVSLIDMPTVTDAVLLFILQRPNLRALTLINCPLLTGICAAHIAMSGAKLERIRVHGCDRLQRMINKMR